MEERYLSIKNYRNLGVEKEEQLLLNTNITNGRMGDLVLIVGPNNSGKSNVLDALLALGSKDGIKNSDITDYNNNHIYPKLELVVRNRELKIGYSKSLTDKGETCDLFLDRKNEKRITNVQKEYKPSKEALQFGYDLLTKVPYEETTEVTKSPEAKSFGIKAAQNALNYISRSGQYNNNFSREAASKLYNNLVAGNWNLDNIENEFIKLFKELKTRQGSNYTAWASEGQTIEKANRYEYELTHKVETKEIKLSRLAIQLLASFQLSQVKITENMRAFAIKLINLAVESDIKNNIARGKKSIISDKLKKLYETDTKLLKLEQSNITEELSEAFDVCSKLIGPRFYNSQLYTDKDTVDEIFKKFHKSASPKIIDIDKNNFDFVKHAKVFKEVFDYAFDKFDHYGIDVDAHKATDFYAQLTNKEIKEVSPEIVDLEQKFNIHLKPNILLFKENQINQSALVIKPNQIQDSMFFKILFKAINYSPKELISLYRDINEGSKVTRMLRITEDEINDKLEMINQQFNKLFFLKDQRYRFEILLETNKIEFTISIGQLPLQLDRQSTGFRWFFNFFFTVIEQKNLQRGDIVVMDEPATNLHVSGIQELRSFIKKYAAESELTFVISTHSPFFIDPDYLEEIRVVSREEKHAVIDSKFHAIQPEDSDALAPVKSALTVGRHILLNPNNKTIFVEGITDYCYLTAMKKILNIGSGLYFVPIQGLLKESLLESIMKIDKYPTILVDSDNIGKGVAKRAMMNEYVNKVQIIKLSDVNPDHREIEDLFDKEDRPNEKTFLAAVTFKNNCNSQNLSPVTLKNFSALIRKLES